MRMDYSEQRFEFESQDPPSGFFMVEIRGGKAVAVPCAPSCFPTGYGPYLVKPNVRLVAMLVAKSPYGALSRIELQGDAEFDWSRALDLYFASIPPWEERTLARRI